MSCARTICRLMACAALSAGANAQSSEPPLLAAIFADHVVLQRERPVEVWGQARPGEQVTVTLGNASRGTRADNAGHWDVSLPAMPAGGPHTLSARTPAREQRVADIQVGDVWLCSGQSNMEWPVRMSLDADSEVRRSANDGIRHVTIPRATAAAPQRDFTSQLEWKVAGPSTTQDFSAVCYFFARELQQHTRVPQGLINSSWGGTRIETWLSPAGLRQLGGQDEPLNLLGEFAADAARGAAHWGRDWQQWWQGQAVTRGSQPWARSGNTGNWQRAPAQLTHWERWGVAALASYDGMLWYRAQVKLSAAQARQVRQISLGRVDDVELVWVNGRPMASGYGEEPRVHRVPPGMFEAGDNLVAVNVFDMWGSGGMHGAPADRALILADGSRIPLADWEYQLPPEGLSPMPRAPWEPHAGISILYNAMVAPLGKFGLRGVAWYQGEANAGLGDAQRYQAQLQTLFSDWRRQFESPLPFLVVQLANWNALATRPVNSGWARLRDAQRRAVAEDGNAGLAVTIDIGERDDIHPANKQEVGRRLARAARHVVFKEKLSPSGAQPLGAVRAVKGVEVRLGGFDGQLLVIGALDPAGFELCGSSQASCHFVRAQLGEDGAVLLEDAAPEKATRVRFCWADAPLCNLYDSTGLPVGPFEVPVN